MKPKLTDLGLLTTSGGDDDTPFREMPWLDAPAAEVQQRIAGVDAHELEELLAVRARLARAPDAARRLTAAPSKRRRGGWDAAASARRRHTEPGSFREAAAGRPVAEVGGRRKRVPAAVPENPHMSK